MFLRGALGRSGRKRATRASRYLFGRQGGFLSASTLMAAAGIAWGVWESLQAQQQTAAPAQPGTPTATPAAPQPVPSTPALPPEVSRVVRLAASAAKADGVLSEAERTLILARAADAGVQDAVAEALAQPRPLAEIVAGVTGADARDLYVLAFTIVRADDTVSGAERIYLAQLAHALGLDAATAATLEAQTAASIDQTPPGPPAV
jgi:uncharacterized membrane protein YebE (DUF533 family)